LLRRAIGASLPQQSVAGSWPNYHQGGVEGAPTGFKPKLIPFALDPQLEGKFRGIAVGACTTTPSQARQANFGRLTARARNCTGITSNFSAVSQPISTMVP
jgi:hypothetical protein